jgi:hypothetical protein
MYPVAVVLQYTKITKHIQTLKTIHNTQNYKHNNTKLQTVFQPKKEPKVEYNTIIQKTRNTQKNKDTTVIKVTLS